MLVLTNAGWFNTFQRPHQLARCFSRRYSLVVLNEYVRLSPMRRDASFAEEQRALVSEVRPVYMIDESLLGPFRMVNQLLSDVQHARMFRRIARDDAPVLYTWKVDDAQWLEHCSGKVVVYDAMDDWAAFASADPHVTDREQRIVQRADIVLTVSEKLRDRLVRFNPNTLLVRNGADLDHFGSALTRAPNAADELYQFRDRGVIGYMGHLQEWVDTELITHAARRNPDLEFVVIGPGDPSVVARLRGLRNVRYLGPRPYSRLPEYVSYFRAGLIPFRLNVLNESTNPIKLYEYLAAGVGVVSTAMPEVARVAAAGVVHVATDADGFADEITAVLASARDPEAIKRRLALARENGWEERARIVVDAIEAALAARVRG